MTVRNKASRYDLVIDAINNAPRTARGSSAVRSWCERRLAEHHAYVLEHGGDMPEVRDWSLGDWATPG